MIGGIFVSYFFTLFYFYYTQNCHTQHPAVHHPITIIDGSQCRLTDIAPCFLLIIITYLGLIASPYLIRKCSITCSNELCCTNIGKMVSLDNFHCQLSIIISYKICKITPLFTRSWKKIAFSVQSQPDIHKFKLVQDLTSFPYIFSNTPLPLSTFLLSQ